MNTNCVNGVVLFCVASFSLWQAYDSAAQTPVQVNREGFVEPFRTLDIASDEAGIIEQVMVKEGQSIKAGQPLVRLNSDVHKSLLAIAEQNMNAKGTLEAAKAELTLRKNRLEKLKALRKEGHARQEEVDRAQSEVRVAEANLLAANEESISRSLEYQRIKTQLQRRTVVSPIDGVVTTLRKDLGEYVSPNNPEILTLVQIDTLLANFTLMSVELDSVETGQNVEVQFSNSTQKTAGTIEYISPTTDAESGTVLIKVKIDNQKGEFRSGERCSLHLLESK